MITAFSVAENVWETSEGVHVFFNLPSALKKALVSDFAKNTTEEIQDIVGGMVSSNTETGIAVSYEDGDGTLDFVVSDTTVAGDSGSTGITPGDTLTIAGGTNATTAMSGDTLTVNVDDAFLKNNADDTTSGTVTMANLIVGDAGNIGSASDTDAIAIASDGEVTLEERIWMTKLKENNRHAEKVVKGFGIQ